MDSSPAFSWIHERMPAILETESDIDSWLDTKIPALEALSKLKASSILKCHPVSTDVNSSRNQGDHLARPIDLNKPKPLSGSGKFMANWLSKGSPARTSPSKVDKKSEPASPPKEGVKRQLSVAEDSVQCTKKFKEEETSGS